MSGTAVQAECARSLRRLLQWRMPLGWWGVLFLGIPICFYGGAALKGTIDAPLLAASWPTISLAFAQAFFIGPIEEFGWRGIALPLLQRSLSPLTSAVLLGLIWGLWHLPAFFLGGAPQASWSFPAFLLAIVALSVILTSLFNASGGSLLVAALFHAQANGPLWPDAQPWDSITFVALAVVVVWIDRERMFRCGGGVTAMYRDASPDVRTEADVRATARMGSGLAS